jgi:hypothetical protein
MEENNLIPIPKNEEPQNPQWWRQHEKLCAESIGLIGKRLAELSPELIITKFSPENEIKEFSPEIFLIGHPSMVDVSRAYMLNERLRHRGMDLPLIGFKSVIPFSRTIDIENEIPKRIQNYIKDLNNKDID